MPENSKKQIFFRKFQSNGPRGTYKNWSDMAMQKAVRAVEEGTSIRVAAVKYTVPRSSLHDRVTGKVGFQNRPGPSLYLSFEERGNWQVS